MTNKQVVIKFPPKGVKGADAPVSVSQAMELIGFNQEECREITDSAAAVIAGQFIADMRHSVGITQKDLGYALGWKQQRISHLESGKSKNGVTIGVLMALASACGGRVELKFIPDENAKNDMTNVRVLTGRT